MPEIDNKTLTRGVELQQRDIDEENRTVELAFSSEQPVGRWFGQEILDHAPGSVRLGRMQNGGAVLMDHNIRDHVGVVESVTIDSDRRGRATVRFGRSARADEIFKDVVDGIRKHISVGYRIHKAVLEETGDDDVYRVTDWEPYEISFVSVPADDSVGVGRSADFDIRSFLDTKEAAMPEAQETTSPAETRTEPTVDVKTIESNARKAEQERIRTISNTSAIYAVRGVAGVAELERQFIENGRSVAEFNAALLDKMGERESDPVSHAAGDVGMSGEEVRRFSFVRAINALANPADRRAQQAAAFEFECSDAAAEQYGRESRGIMIPSDVLNRDLVVGTTTAGGHTVSTDLSSGSFIDMLVNATVVMQRATRMNDLVGNIAIPRQTGGATAYWVAESGAPTESQQAFDQVTLSPNTVGAFTDFSRKLMLQSSLDVEAFVRRDLARTIALELDRVCINGSGSSNQPTGILNTTGIGSVAGGTDGLAPAWSHIINLESEVANDNADVGSLFYITNTKVRGKLKQTEKASSTGQFVWGDNDLNGYTPLVTNQVPSTLDKGTSTGVCSAIIFGNLADLLVGMWSGLDLMVDPYTNSTSGTVRVVGLQDVDLAVRHAESFAAMKDALTA